MYTCLVIYFVHTGTTTASIPGISSRCSSYLVPTTAQAAVLQMAGMAWRNGRVVLPMENHPSSQINIWLIMSWLIVSVVPGCFIWTSLKTSKRQFPDCHAWEIYPTTLEEAVYLTHHTTFNIGNKYTLNKVVPQKKTNLWLWLCLSIGPKIYRFFPLSNGHWGGLSVTKQTNMQHQVVNPSISEE